MPSIEKMYRSKFGDAWLPRDDRDHHRGRNDDDANDCRPDVQPDNRLQMRDVERRHDEIPVAEHHRAARAAEQRDRTEEAGDGQQRHQSRRVARHLQRLQDDRDQAPPMTPSTEAPAECWRACARWSPSRRRAPLRQTRSAAVAAV